MSAIMQRKKAIGVDLDNVLACTDDKIRELIQAMFGVVSRSADIKTWNYHESISITQEQERLLFKEFHEHHLLELDPLPGARTGMLALSKIAALWIITQRPMTAKNDTREWLRRSAIPYTKLVFSADKLSFANELRVLIEDNGCTALAFAERGIPVLLLDHPWNRFVGDVKDINRVRSWREIVHCMSMPMREHALELV